MSDAVIVLIILVAAVGLFVLNRLSVGLVAVLTALALLATGVIDVPTALAGFGDPVVIFIATLFVVSEGLQASGITSWAGRTLTEKAGTRRAPLLVAIMVLSGAVSALITPNGAAAALVPVVATAARRARIAASYLLIPTAFAASAGALLTLSGSPVNILVHEASLEAGGGGFGFFEFALVGLPLLVVTVAVAALFGTLLPDRGKGALVGDLGGHLSTLIEHYALDQGFFRLRVVGALPATALAAHPEVEVVGMQDPGGHPCTLERDFRDGDVLVVTGEPEAVQGAAAALGLVVDTAPLTRETRSALLNQEVGLAEIVVPPRSTVVGRVCFPGMVMGKVTVLGISRMGRDVGARRVELVEGDSLLLHGTWPAVTALAQEDEVLVVDAPELLRRQAPPRGAPAIWTVVVLVGMVVMLASGRVAPAVAGLIAAAALVALRVVTPARVYRSISWQTLLLIGALIPLSVAVRDSGAADMIASWMVGLVGDGHPLLLLLAVFMLTALLGQFISNAATVLVVMPIALAVGADAGISVQTMLMTVAVSGAASLLTPIATPANMIVMGPGGYRFGDYWRLGSLTMVAWLVVGMLLIPVIWGYR
ncbi:MAG: SLC13 family permease [Micrococcales bacterium]|nr:SLC13 family permease [Micrococcales bacterium]